MFVNRFDEPTMLYGFSGLTAISDSLRAFSGLESQVTRRLTRGPWTIVDI